MVGSGNGTQGFPNPGEHLPRSPTLSPILSAVPTWVWRETRHNCWCPCCRECDLSEARVKRPQGREESEEGNGFVKVSTESRDSLGMTGRVTNPQAKAGIWQRKYHGVQTPGQP